MPVLVESLMTNFAAGYAIGAGVALWMVGGAVGPGAMMAESWLATALFVQAAGSSLGLGYLSTAVLISDRA